MSGATMDGLGRDGGFAMTDEGVSRREALALATAGLAVAQL
jgi:hypothetical protein